MNPNHKTQNWCFTLNNFTPDEVTLLHEATQKGGIASGLFVTDIVYLIYGKEHDTKLYNEEHTHNNTPHLQGYVQFKHQKTMSSVKRFLGSKRYHLEPAKGNAQQNITYCSKEDTNPFIFGTPRLGKGKGKRNDLTAIKDLVKQSSIPQLIEDNLLRNTQQVKFAETCNLHQQQHRSEYPHVEWIYGSTMTLKSHQIYKDHDANDIHKQTSSNKFWCGYENQPVVILDDIRADFAKFHELLTLLDKYPHKVEVKCSHRKFNSSTIYITSPYSPEEMYANKTSEALEQLYRRIDVISHHTRDGEELIVTKTYPRKAFNKTNWINKITINEVPFIMPNSDSPSPVPTSPSDFQMSRNIANWDFKEQRPKKNVKRKVMINNILEEVTECNESE